jgi:lysophospholipase L1-like esterase
MGGFPSLPQPMRTVLALHARHLDRRLASAVANTPSAIHSSTPPIDSLDLYAEDGFHPGAEGYRRWAAHLAAAAAAMLSTEAPATGTGEHGRSVTT